MATTPPPPPSQSFSTFVSDAFAPLLASAGGAPETQRQLRAIAILHIYGKFVAVEELLTDLAERGHSPVDAADPWDSSASSSSAPDADRTSSGVTRKTRRARVLSTVDALRIKLERFLVLYTSTQWGNLAALAAANTDEELAAAELYASTVVSNAIVAAHADRTRRSVVSMQLQREQLRRMGVSAAALATDAAEMSRRASSATAAAAKPKRVSCLSASTRAKVRSAANKVLSQHIERKLSQQRKWSEIIEMGLEMKKTRRQSIAIPTFSLSSFDRMSLLAVGGGGRRYSQGRPPVLLMIGGGMSAGKSTAVKTMLSTSEFWKSHQESAVTVEADRFKIHDPVFRALTKTFHMGGTAAKLVHSHSTEAAEKLFIHAVNDARDIIFDGTMSWCPFVEQVVAMVQDGGSNFKRGRGWVPAAGDLPDLEEYFVRDLDSPRTARRPPYRIEVLGVTCGIDVAVARALRRTLETGRGVPLQSQLRSHRLFADNFARYVELADQTFLYDSTVPLATPVLVASSAEDHIVSIHHPTLFTRFSRRAHLDDRACDASSIFPDTTEAAAVAVEGESEEEAADVIDITVRKALADIASHFTSSAAEASVGERRQRRRCRKQLSMLGEEVGEEDEEEEY